MQLIINRAFHTVLNALMVLYSHFVVLPTLTTPLSIRIADDYRFAQYFYNCIGAIDGTHIHAANVPYDDQNVLAACDFDGSFVYTLPGWEGSAHDGRILADAETAKGFITSKGKYWLGDAGYGNTEFVMAPYRGVRNHLKEQRQANQR